MLEIDTLWEDLLAKQTFMLQGIPYRVKNCVAAAEGNMLKANLCLASGDAIEVVMALSLKVINQSPSAGTACITKIAPTQTVEHIIITQEIL